MKKNDVLAFQRMEQAAKLEHLDALEVLGIMLCEGVGVEKDCDKGNSYIQKAYIKKTSGMVILLCRQIVMLL